MLADKLALYKTLHADVVHNKSEGKPVAEDLDEPASGLTERGEKRARATRAGGSLTAQSAALVNPLLTRSRPTNTT